MTSVHDRAHPSLPQNDDPSEQKDRAESIADAREAYVWTTAVKTLPGVPLAASVPFADEPSIPWALTAAETAIPIVENAVADKLESNPAIASELDRIKADVGDLRERHTAAQSPGQALEEGVKGMFEAAAGAVSHLLGRDNNNIWEHLQHLQSLLEEHRHASSEGVTLASYQELFSVLPLPDVAHVFMEDATFARMRVAGPNPMLIAAATEVPAGMEQVEGAAAALADKRLFVLDYQELDTLVPGTSEERQQYLWRPIALFTVDEHGSLRAMAIKLDQAEDATVVTPPSDGQRDWRWEMAKFAVQVADGNYHELFVHLARTHLVEEALAMATRRALAPQHPMSLLFLPHFQGTLFINNLAAGSLIAEGGPIDNIFAGTIDTTQLAAANDRLNFQFAASMVPTELAARGVTTESTLQDFPYRDDAMLIWTTLRDWVYSYVSVYYADDQEVLADTELAAWSSEIQGSGRLEGFTAPTTRQELVEVATMTLFTASAQHAAVNFPQRTLMTYAPNVTGAGWAPANVDKPTETTWLDMMPPLDLAGEQLATLEGLGGVYFTQLGEYKNPGFPYGDWFRDDRVTRPGGPLETFRDALRQVEATIEARNAERTVAYPYLLPSKIPESINI